MDDNLKRFCASLETNKGLIIDDVDAVSVEDVIPLLKDKYGFIDVGPFVIYEGTRMQKTDRKTLG